MRFRTGGAAARRFRREFIVAIVAALPALSACDLTEVSIAPAEDIVVVEGVLRAYARGQSIVLHRSIRDRTVRAEPGAQVTLSNRGGGSSITLAQTDDESCVIQPFNQDADSVLFHPSCYGTPLNAGVSGFDVMPGETYDLQVLTSDGREIRGRTTVPGNFGLRWNGRIEYQRIVCSVEPWTNTPFSWTVARGAWSYLSTLEIRGLDEALVGRGIDAPPRLELNGVSISETDTTVVVPSEIGVLNFGEVDQDILKVLQEGFPPGVTVRLVIAAADRNFVNSVRGGSFNPSGQVRISSVIGDGVGVFGSVITRDVYMVVESNSQLPRCGS